LDRDNQSIIEFRENPERDEAIFKLGQYYEDKGLFHRALKCYQRAIDKSKGNPMYLIKKAKMLAYLNCHTEAISLIQPLSESEHHDAFIHSELSLIYKKLGQTEEAIRHIKEAVFLDSKNPQYYLQLGDLFHKKGYINEAILSYKQSLFYNDNNCITLNNLAISCKDNHQLEEAIDNFQRALSLCPDEPYIHFNYAQCLLLSGNMTEGFKEYEWRLKKDDYKNYLRDYQKPYWRGEYSNSTIVIFAEQGFGDTIHFVRYINLVKERGLKVILLCHEELKELFMALQGLQGVYSFQEALPEFDLQCPILSLPYIFKTTLDTIPAKIPYLTARSDKINKFKELTETKGTLKIGLTWAGNPAHEDDLNRSISFDYFYPLLSLKGFTFFSLQFGEAAKCSDESLIDLSSHIKDFSDTAGLIDSLDFIITVDTAIAHLAGAMGKETWLLLPYTPDWRWMLNNSTTPWYPTVRLFRQVERGNWQGVIKEVVNRCKQLKF